MTDVSIILFGMPRSIDPFLESITKTLLNPMEKKKLQYRVVGQLNSPVWVSNPRSKEEGQIDRPEKLSAEFPEVVIERQDESSIVEDFHRLSAFGDIWRDNFRSLSNLLHQQNSLKIATRMALATPASHFIFLRPDLLYHDDFSEFLDRFLRKETKSVALPGWQTCSGLNDRFAFVVGREAASAYGLRLHDADRFVLRRNRPLHSERLLAFSLGTKRIPVQFIPHRASRCRLDGTFRLENFALKLRVELRTQLRLRLYPSSFA